VAAAGRVGRVLEGTVDGRGTRIGVVCSRFNAHVTSRLLEGALAGLEEAGVRHDDVTVAFVPGAFELPLAARRLALSGAIDAVVCLGAVIRGETDHHRYVAGQCAAGLQRVQLDTGVPCVFGVLTTDTVEQALERAGGTAGNKGFEAALAAVEMASLLDGIDGPGGRRRERPASGAGPAARSGAAERRRVAPC
jgi:6,7-dimethyl-8-ribityllumazine synthase